MPKKWIVSSGGHKVEAEGDTPFQACVEAVKTGEFMKLGHILSVTPKGDIEDDDSTFYCSSIKVVQAAGMLSDA